MLRAVLALSLLTVSLGCSGPDQLECVDVDPACAPLYAPTWENVFTNTLRPKCGTGGGACHEGVGAKGGLRLDESEVAYRTLTAPEKGYVIVDDASCSELVQRVYTPSSALRMPRGSSLPDSERCALTRWVLAGAPGPIDAGVGP
ncbi:MAG: hypothetical protein K8M05_17285 [Deltaproteobacteria bacterium]|nr:hypothetical protein [Kofleriaceae bacterium]